MEEAPGVSVMCTAQSSFMHTVLPDLLTKVFSSDIVEGCDTKPLEKDLLDLKTNIHEQRLLKELLELNPDKLQRKNIELLN